MFADSCLTQGLGLECKENASWVALIFITTDT